MKSLPWPLPLRGPWTREMRTPLRLQVKKRQKLSCFLEAPKFLHASLLCLFDDVKL